MTFFLYFHSFVFSIVSTQNSVKKGKEGGMRGSNRKNEIYSLVLSPSGTRPRFPELWLRVQALQQRWPLSVLGEQCFSAETEPLLGKLWLAGHRKGRPLLDDTCFCGFGFQPLPGFSGGWKLQLSESAH